MTVTEFNRIAHDAHIYGILLDRHTREPLFGCGEEIQVTSYEFQGFICEYEDSEFSSMTNKETGEIIKRENCTTHNLDGYSINELQQIVEDAQKLIKYEQNKKAQVAIDNFIKAWQELQKYQQVRVRVQGAKTHFHDTVNNVKLTILPLD